MNRIITTLGVVLLIFNLSAQENNIELMRELGVKQVEKHLFVHVFKDNKDTCFFYKSHYDSLQRMEYEWVNMNCYGYNQLDEKFYSYPDSLSSRMEVKQNEEALVRAEFQMNDRGLPLKIKTYFYRTQDSSTNYFQYFYGDYEMPDSGRVLLINQEGDTIWSKNKSIFNQQGKPLELLTYDGQGKLKQSIMYEYVQDSLVANVSTTNYGEEGDFNQLFYEYDEKGRVSAHYNARNQKQENLYMKNGLLHSLRHYDPTGKLEAEVIYKYQYR